MRGQGQFGAKYDMCESLYVTGLIQKINPRGYTRSQHYTNIMIVKHEIQIFKVVVVVLLLMLLLFDVLVPISADPFQFALYNS